MIPLPDIDFAAFERMFNAINEQSLLSFEYRPDGGIDFWWFSHEGAD
jgi:hypothetical protein